MRRQIYLAKISQIVPINYSSNSIRITIAKAKIVKNTAIYNPKNQQQFKSNKNQDGKKKILQLRHLVKYEKMKVVHNKNNKK